MGNTKQKILNVSLDLFSQKGFSAVSIRDICAQVMIKESTVYYHFKNKQAIFDELLYRFEQVVTNMIIRLENSLSTQSCFAEKTFYQTVCDAFFEKYFMEPLMFAEPLEFQSKVFFTLMEIGIIPKSDSRYLAVKYYAPIYFCSQVVI